MHSGPEAVPTGSLPRPDDLTRGILRAAFEVHSELGAGLLERVYRICLQRELERAGYRVRAEVTAPIVYKGERIEGAYRIDLVVEDSVLVEVKAVDTLLDVHFAQTLTYLKLTGLEVGLLLNFNVPHLREGIRRVVLRRA